MWTKIIKVVEIFAYTYINSYLDSFAKEIIRPFHMVVNETKSKCTWFFFKFLPYFLRGIDWSPSYLCTYLRKLRNFLYGIVF